MLINRHDCIEKLINCNDTEADILLDYLMKHPKEAINKDICNYFIKKKIEIPVIEHYKLLNNKAHKVIKETLECEGKDVATYIKIATSLITQGTITLEHKFKDSVDDANNFIRNTLLCELSQALYLYFNYNDYTELVSVIGDIRNDIKLILD